jgi:tetratricopeptide (TPR) repeat protein
LIAGIILCVMGLILIGLGIAWMGEQTLEPDSELRQPAQLEAPGPMPFQATAMVAKAAVAVDLTPERARIRLAHMAPLLLPAHGPADDGVKSTLLCFCLHKGPETVRELRRLAAEKFRQGVAAMESENYQLAVDAFSQAIQRHPREARAFVNRGLAHAHLHRYQESRADLTQAIALHETLADAYYGRGLVAILTGDHDGAKADFQHAVRLGDERALRLSQTETPPARKGL